MITYQERISRQHKRAMAHQPMWASAPTPWPSDGRHLYVVGPTGEGKRRMAEIMGRRADLGWVLKEVTPTSFIYIQRSKDNE